LLAAQIDQFIDILTDITTLISSTQVENRDIGFLKSINKKLSILNKAINKNNNFIVKDYFSIADIAIWSFMCWLTGGNIASVPKDVAKNYENILRLCRKIDSKDIIQKWVNKTFPKKYSRNFY
jgi:glutathione S-transferase